MSRYFWQLQMLLMKNILLPVFIILSFMQVNAQYYYSDIIGTKQTNQQYKLLRAFQFQHINAISFDGNQPAKDFLLEQVITDDGRQITTHSASAGSMESYFISNYQNNKLNKTVDSGNNAINTVLYEYDNTGKVISTSAASKDFDKTFTNEERHIWSYNEKGLPQKMIKIKNHDDTTLVMFSYDDDNLAEEKWIKNKRIIETYYYYYNPKKQLTDIVRFSRKAKAMLPDYIFEYDIKGRVTQMTQTQSGSANYLVWKYTYNENGMKEKEIVFNKQKEMLGRIEYNYR
jgi:hypothetical protein